MTPDEVEKRLNEQEGKITGLTLLLASLLRSNPDIIFDEKDLSRMIRSSGEKVEAQREARDVLHSVKIFSKWV
jgi:hypothetical protein